MSISRYIVLLMPLVLTAGCATSGPVDDGFDLSQESVNIGKFLGDDVLRVSLETSIEEPEKKQPGEISATVD